MEPRPFKLPNSVISRFDIARLLRELSALDNFFATAARRSAGTPISPPSASRLLTQVAEENQCNLLNTQQRQNLYSQLEILQKIAPQLNISFASDPSPVALERIVVWFRSNVHAQALLQVGLQPGIAAGCVLRTPNRQFDMSLRSHLDAQKDHLMQLIAGAMNEK